MRNGFTFNGIHSSQFGATVKTKSRPIRPAKKCFLTDVPCRDGEYDFSASNAAGREFFSSRIFTVTVTVCADDIYKLQNKLSRVSKWLLGSGTLIFDDMPMVEWRAQISEDIIYLPESGAKSATVEISFRAEPFAYCIFNSQGPYIGSEAVTLGEYIPIGMEDLYKYAVSGIGMLDIFNCGDRPARPAMLIEGAASAVKLTDGEKTLSFNATGSVTVDFDTQTVTDGNGSVSVSGEFFELRPGNNVWRIENSNVSELGITVIYTPEFMYNAVFEDVEWGDASA